MYIYNILFISTRLRHCNGWTCKWKSCKQQIVPAFVCHISSYILRQSHKSQNESICLYFIHMYCEGWVGEVFDLFKVLKSEFAYHLALRSTTVTTSMTWNICRWPGTLKWTFISHWHPGLVDGRQVDLPSFQVCLGSQKHLRVLGCRPLEKKTKRMGFYRVTPPKNS